MPRAARLDSPDNELIELICRVSARDEEAFRQLYDRVAPRLFGLAMRITRRRQDAEDALQDAFAYIWRSAGSYMETLSPPLGWLMLITRSKALDVLRQQLAGRGNMSVEFNEELHDMSSENDPGGGHVTSAQVAALGYCLTQLHPRQREAMILAYYRDMSHSELAAELRAPLGTVKTWIRTGLKMLRGCMQSYIPMLTH